MRHNPWKLIDSNPDINLYEARARNGALYRVLSRALPDPSPLEHFSKYGAYPEPREIELGQRGFRIRFRPPEWAEPEGFVPRDGQR